MHALATKHTKSVQYESYALAILAYKNYGADATLDGMQLLWACSSLYIRQNPLPQRAGCYIKHLGSYLVRVKFDTIWNLSVRKSP